LNLGAEFSETAQGFFGTEVRGIMTIIPNQTCLLLVPDASAGRRIRHVIASKKIGFGVKVITWIEFLEEIRLAYLLPPLNDDWNETILQAIKQMGGGYWYQSFEVDPNGTTSTVAATLDEAIRGGTKDNWFDSSLSERTNTTLSDLWRLWEHMEFSLPPELKLIKAVQVTPERAISHFSIYWIDGWPRLDHFQSGFLNLLNERGAEPKGILMDILREVFSLPELSEATPAPQKLAHFCFTGSKGAISVTDDIGFLIARDPLQEVECTTGIIQSLTEQGVSPEDIGVLLPDAPYYHQAFAASLFMIGQPAAGLSTQIPLRDLGGEIVRSLILLARGPVPKMALASLVSSPLAPWTSEIANQLGSSVIAGRFNLEPPYGMSDGDQKHLSVIRRLRDGKASIVDGIEIFAKSSDDPSQAFRLRALAKQISEQVMGSDIPDYDRLLELVGHVTATVDQPTTFPQNGIRVFHENQEPWTKVKHLIILGFNCGRYPSLPGTSPVLHDLEKQAINKRLVWDLPTSNDILSTRRERFKRQSASATETIKFMASARGIDGSSIQLSETATFLAGLLGLELENLFTSVAQDNKWLPRAAAVKPTIPRSPEPIDLEFGRDLLSLKVNRNGEPIPESPSSLETLLVSPLAWFLRRFGADPDPWDVDTLDARLQGNIAHTAFEILFPANANLFEEDQVEEAVDGALMEAIRREAPLLTTAQWKVERNSLRSTLIRAASHWRNVLKVLNAEVVGAEAPLKGQFKGVSIKGYSDEVIRLPDGTLIVVDFKKSASGKRRDRMGLGYDCQVNLYQKMISENIGDICLEPKSAKPGIVYFTLNDQRVLTDQNTGLAANTPGLIVVPGDVSANALKEITGRISMLRKGIVEMNRDDDEKSLEKEKALPNFALEVSPLVMMFAHPVSTEDAE